MRKTTLSLLCLILLASTLAAEQALQIFYNGKKSNLQSVKAQDLELVPVYFPVTPGDTSYTVTVHYDVKTRKVEVQRTPQGPKKRDESPCAQCSGTGKCQNDYPSGCGNNTAGQSCPMCNATGNCWYCNGTGKNWK